MPARSARPRQHPRGSTPNRFAIVLAGTLIAGALVALVLTFTSGPPSCTRFSDDLVGRTSFAAPPCPMLERDVVYTAALETSMGTIRVGLDQGVSPESVNNFVFLAKVGFYDGTTFHRIENAPDHAIIQAGDPTGTGRGGPGYTYVETPSPITRYLRGIVAMATPVNSNVHGSQFFIVVRDYDAIGTPHKTPVNSILGALVDDEETKRTIDAIAAVRTDGVRPLEPVVIRTVRIEERARG